MVYYLPTGTKNLTALFAGFNFSDVEEFYVQAIDEDDTVVASSPVTRVADCNCKHIRLHFLNYLGTYDAMNFERPVVVHEATSEQFKKPLPVVLQKSASSTERINVKATDAKAAKSTGFTVDHMPWVQELIDSPKTFEEWKGVQGQADDFVPVIITDRKLDKIKTEKEYTYDFTIEYKMGNGASIIRN